MPEWILQLWGGINANAEGISAVVAALVALGGVGAWILSRRNAGKPSANEVRGGKGGDASVGGNGVAIGGRGGRSGLGGVGGDGGGGHVSGDGMAMGGDGGDAGTPWRPALGAPSPMERLREMGMGAWPDMPRDEFGFFVVGRGGNGGDVEARVSVDGRDYPLLPLTMLLRLWAPDTLEAADATRPDGAQAFWSTVTRLDHAVASAAEEHVRRSLEVANREGQSPPDPYARRDGKVR